MLGGRGMPRPWPDALVARSRRLAMLGGLALAWASLAGCDRGAQTQPDDSGAAVRERMDDVLPHPEPAGEGAFPLDRAGILRELAPLPFEALLVVYELEGPGGVSGRLEVLARPGGYRRENWTVQVPLGAEGSRQLAGWTIQTPEGVWIDGAAALDPTPAPLGALADAWLALPEGARRRVVEQLRARTQKLAQARASEAEAPEQILDTPCHVTRVATIELCLWEATGLPLRYASDGLRLRAIHIDEAAGIGPHAFDPPGPLLRAGVPGLDAAAVLERAAQGDLGELAPWLHAGLRLPT